jgi:hypothetical protein
MNVIGHSPVCSALSDDVDLGVAGQQKKAKC